jgi:hypothetical protein
MVVPRSQPLVDGLFQLLHTAKGPGDESKPTLYLIEPGTAGGREMKVEAAALLLLSHR